MIVNCSTVKTEAIYIHTNQTGFLPNDIKTALILSNTDLTRKDFFVLDNLSGETVLRNLIDSSSYSFGNFKYCFEVDFSDIKKTGTYKIKINNTESLDFSVDEKLFNPVRDSLSLFFKVQRCGPTNPILHKPCHLSDAAYLIGYEDSLSRDLTGGWHDAGDYIKFLKTTAYTTYLLLFSYEFDNQKFEYDLDRNNVPDILEEARVGLDWLIRANVDYKKLIIQVQDETDHSVGLRLPENDTLLYNRPAFVSISKNSIGYYSAVLSVAARIWKDKFYDNEFSSKCLDLAERFYKLKDDAPDFDSLYSNHYPDIDFNGKLALAAIELFITTSEKKYINDAVEYGHSAGADYWWSVGQINSLAHYKIAEFKPEFADYIYQNLKMAKENSGKNPFRIGLDFSWGTTNCLLGVSLQSILFKKLTGSVEFDSLNIYQRDFVLGRNAWGVSFIYNIGKNFSKNLHSQIAFFNNGYLPGGLAAGPAPYSILKTKNILRKNSDYNFFNSDEIKYYDDYKDFVTNEPTLAGNATALFVFGYFSSSE
ncbi:MAG: glycoside hydrolase family 9 protein [Ignavibacteriaceae bacterium]|jgi:hypothetical protein|nr:glycoside hydrolase family 9 protein [Ignavibacteriaceae bacterium]